MCVLAQYLSCSIQQDTFAELAVTGHWLYPLAISVRVLDLNACSFAVHALRDQQVAGAFNLAFCCAFLALVPRRIPNQAGP